MAARGSLQDGRLDFKLPSLDPFAFYAFLRGQMDIVHQRLCGQSLHELHQCLPVTCLPTQQYLPCGLIGHELEQFNIRIDALLDDPQHLIPRKVPLGL